MLPEVGGSTVPDVPVVGFVGCCVVAAVESIQNLKKNNKLLLQVHFLYNLQSTHNDKIYCLPTQQSAAPDQLLPDDEKSLLQLLLPHVRVPEHCESVSQSPPPAAH